MSSNKKNRAFSLIELCVIILVIGIFISAIFVADGMISKFRIKTASALTVSSPINSISLTSLWLETSLESSFNSSNLSTGDSLSSWNDQKNTSNKIAVTAVGTGPEYSNTINRVHAVKFSGSSTNYLEIADASFLNGSDYTIIVLEKRQSANANNYFFGDSTITTANQSLLLGYKLDGKVTHSQGSGTSYDSTISAYADSTDKPRVFTFVQSSSYGKRTYINGVLAAQDPSTTKLSGMTRLAIGKGYSGEIGEIVIFAKTLLNEERKSVEDYLGKKWVAKINRDAVAGGSCTTGTVTDTGCSMDCSTSSINGVSSPTTVTDGQTNVTATCGATGYSNSITVSCPAGTGTITKSGDCPCNTGLGYSPVGGACVPQCSFASTSITGILTTTANVNAGTGLTQSCNGTNFKTTDSITFDCANGNIANVSGSCTCNTGYAISGTTCSAIVCSITGVSGFNNKTNLDYTATPVTIISPCQGGHSGTPTYTCTTTGAATISGACTVPLSCTGGTKTTFGGRTTHKFTTNGSLTCTTGSTTALDVVVIGGGGGGGGGDVGSGGGGGGGGAVVVSTNNSIGTGTINVTIGAGGTAGTGSKSGTSATRGGNGQDTTISGLLSITSKGGGGGGSSGSPVQNTSGSPAGGGSNLTTGGTGSYSGGASTSYTYPSGSPYGSTCGGGGGSSSAAGGSCVWSGTKGGGRAGAGISVTLNGFSGTYGGGGVGGSPGYGCSFTNTGGGGNGGASDDNCTIQITAGTANTGGGGGGGGCGLGDAPSSAGAGGGSGYVVFTY